MRCRRNALVPLTLFIGLAGTGVLWLRSQQRQYALNRQLINALVEAGADPNTRYTPMPVPSLPELVKQLFHRSAPPVNDSPTALLIACGAPWNNDVATANAQERRPDDPHLVQAMLRHGADVNARDDNGSTPLLWAVYCHRPKTARILVANGANVNASNDSGDLPLLQAVRFRTSLDTVRLLIEHGADVNAKDAEGVTPLMGAGVNDVYPSAVPLLLDHGADVNATDKAGWTPLMNAVRNLAAPDTVRLLLEHGAKVNARDEDGKTALNGILPYRHTPTTNTTVINLIRLLLTHGANPNIADRYRTTPLLTAQTRHYDAIAALLRHYGARE